MKSRKLKAFKSTKFATFDWSSTFFLVITTLLHYNNNMARVNNWQQLKLFEFYKVTNKLLKKLDY